MSSPDLSNPAQTPGLEPPLGVVRTSDCFDRNRLFIFDYINTPRWRSIYCESIERAISAN